MKLACSSILFFFLATTIFAADIAEVQSGGSLFDRSALFSNALCLPLFDGCSYRSEVVSCTTITTDDGFTTTTTEVGDTCDSGDGFCVKTAAGGVVCAVDDGSQELTFCGNSRDCARGQVCVEVEGGCFPFVCVKQDRFGG